MQERPIGQMLGEACLKERLSIFNVLMLGQERTHIDKVDQ